MLLVAEQRCDAVNHSPQLSKHSQTVYYILFQMYYISFRCHCARPLLSSSEENARRCIYHVVALIDVASKSFLFSYQAERSLEGNQVFHYVNRVQHTSVSLIFIAIFMCSVGQHRAIAEDSEMTNTLAARDEHVKRPTRRPTRALRREKRLINGA